MMTGTRDYSYYDGNCHSGYNRRCIDGKVTGCSKCVGYCQFEGHSGFLTDRQRKEHECIQKECFYYLPKTKKEKCITSEIKKKETIKNMISAVVSGYEGLKATKIYENKDGAWLVKYITITNGYSMSEIEARLSEMFNITVSMSKVECDFERAAEIIFG